MQTLPTRNLLPVFPLGQLAESDSREAPPAQPVSHGTSFLAIPIAKDRLDSWKEIASYLKRTVRTVQRWEMHEGLPVHRHMHRRANSVYAHRSELDDWWNREARAVEVKPIQTLSKGAPRKFEGSQRIKAVYSRKGCRQIDPTSPEHFVEYVLELRLASLCSPCDGAACFFPCRRRPFSLRAAPRIPKCRTRKRFVMTKIGGFRRLLVASAAVVLTVAALIGNEWASKPVSAQQRSTGTSAVSASFNLSAINTPGASRIWPGRMATPRVKASRLGWDPESHPASSITSGNEGGKPC